MMAQFESFQRLGHNKFVLHLGGRRHFIDTKQAMAMLAAIASGVTTEVEVSSALAVEVQTWLGRTDADDNDLREQARGGA